MVTRYQLSASILTWFWQSLIIPEIIDGISWLIHCSNEGLKIMPSSSWFPCWFHTQEGKRKGPGRLERHIRKYIHCQGVFFLQSVSLSMQPAKCLRSIIKLRVKYLFSRSTNHVTLRRFACYKIELAHAKWRNQIILHLNKGVFTKTSSLLWLQALY